jgi:hypothetical protein
MAQREAVRPALEALARRHANDRYERWNELYQLNVIVISGNWGTLPSNHFA